MPCTQNGCLFSKPCRIDALPTESPCESKECEKLLKALHSPKAERERSFSRYSNHTIIGVDEVGRGCIAGPVVAAAVVLDMQALDITQHSLITDSKTLSAKKREESEKLIKSIAHYAIASIKPAKIDSLGIHKASLEAMRQACMKLMRSYRIQSHILLCIDGRFPLGLSTTYAPNSKKHGKRHIREIAIIKGDGELFHIGAASIIAKTHRDRCMKKLESLFGLSYGFASHVGYPTKAHIQALQKTGVSRVHRKSYAPVKTLLNHS